MELSINKTSLQIEEKATVNLSFSYKHKNYKFTAEYKNDSLDDYNVWDVKGFKFVYDMPQEVIDELLQESYQTQY